MNESLQCGECLEVDVPTREGLCPRCNARVIEPPAPSQPFVPPTSQGGPIHSRRALFTDDARPARPRSVTLAGRFLIAVSIVGWIWMMGLIYYLFYGDSRVRLANPIMVYFVPTVSAAIQICIGIGMLRGQRWSRTLFLFGIPLMIVAGIAFGREPNLSMVIRAGWYCVIAYILARPEVKSFFAARAVD
jgi:hypothetical protein